MLNSMRFNDRNLYEREESKMCSVDIDSMKKENIPLASNVNYSTRGFSKKNKKSFSVLSSKSPGSPLVLKLANRIRYQLRVSNSNHLEEQVQDMQRALDDLSAAFSKEQQELRKLRLAYNEQEQSLEEARGALQQERAKNLFLVQELSQERSKGVELSSKYNKAKLELKDTQDQLQTLLFQHIPTVSSELQEIGPVNYEIAEEADQQVGGYSLGKALGEGYFGQVYVGQALEFPASEQVAIKVLKKHRFAHMHDLKQLNLEVAILRSHKNHPNIIGFHHVLHACKHIYLVMEKGTMDLRTLIRETDMAEAQLDLIQQVMLGILKPLQYLHAQGVCHLDLKPENILIKTSALDENNRRIDSRRIEADDVRLCDFGLCQISGNYDPNNVVATPADGDGDLCEEHDIIRLGRTCGTPGFFAPEMVIRGAYEGRTADLWSVGCVLLDITFGCPNQWMESYGHFNRDAKKFEEGLKACLDEIESMCDIDTEEEHLVHDLIIKYLLQMDINKRATATQAMQHPWFQQYKYYDNSDEASSLAPTVVSSDILC